MNRKELVEKLAAAGVPPGYVSTDGDWTKLNSEGYVLRKSGTDWVVEYFERGGTTERGRFDSEAEACEYIYGRLTGESFLRYVRRLRTNDGKGELS
jgi:hypothetical protein